MRARRHLANVAAAVMVAGGVSLAGAPAALAAVTYSFTIHFTASDPLILTDQYWRDASPCKFTGAGGKTQHYRIFTLTVSQSGTYTFVDNGEDRDQLGGDLTAGVYPLGGFVSASDQTTNCIGGVNRVQEIFLAQGSYTLVVADYVDNPGVESNQHLTVTGPGVVTIPGAGGGHNFAAPTLSIYALILTSLSFLLIGTRRLWKSANADSPYQLESLT